MYSWLITFSLSGKHCDELREALGLEHGDVPDVLDLSETLIHVRRTIALQETPDHTKMGTVLVISDYPQTGKSCLAYTLANDWLGRDQGSSQEQHQVLIMAPQTSADCSIERLSAELRVVPKTQKDTITTLVIIDDLENCLIRSEDPKGLLAWLFKSEPGYHKILLFTEGVVFHKQRQTLFIEHLKQLKKNMEDGGPYLVQSMNYCISDTLKIMRRAFSYRHIGHCSLLEEKDMESQLQNVIDTLTVQRKDGFRSYIIGLAYDILSTTSWTVIDESNQNGILSKAVQRFKKKAFAIEETEQNIRIILRILMTLHVYYKLPFHAGCSRELVFSLFALYNQGSNQAQFDAALESFIRSGLLIESQGMIIAPIVWLKVLFLEEATSNPSNLTEAFDGYLKTVTEKLIRPQSWLQIGIICLARKQVFDAIHAIARCIETSVEQNGVECLADYIISLVNPLILEDSTDHFLLTEELIENVLHQLKVIFPQEDFSLSSTSSPKNRLLQLLIDMIIAKICYQATQRGMSLWTDLNKWQPLLDLSSSGIEFTVGAMALNQLLLLCPDATKLAESIRRVFSFFATRSKERQEDSMSALNVLRLISPLDHSAHDTKIVIERLDAALFSHKMPLSLTQCMHSDFWRQSVQAALYFLKYYEKDSDREDFLFWIKSLMEMLISKFDSSTQRAIALICWSRDILTQATVAENEYHTFFGLLNGYVKNPKIFFQVCLALLASCELNSSSEEQKIKYILKHSVDALKHLNMLNADFQLYLSFFLITCDYLNKQDWMVKEVRKVMDEYKTIFDEKLLPSLPIFYVIDEMQLGINYKRLLEQNFYLPSIKLPSQKWPDRMCLTYLIGLHFFHRFYQKGKVQTLLDEVTDFCQTFSITQQWQKQIDAFVALQNSVISHKNVSPTEATESSRSYKSDPISMHLLSQLLNAKDEKAIDTILNNLLLYLNKYPINSGAWYVLGKFMQKRHDDLKAIDYYKMAWYLAPDVLEAPLEIARIYHKLIKTKQEIAILKEAEHEESNDIVCLMLARAYKDLQKNEKAIHYYRRALALDTDEQYSALQELAEVLAHEQEIGQALSVYWNILRLNYLSTDIVMHILQLLEDLDEHSQLSYLGVSMGFHDVAEALLSYLGEYFASYLGGHLAETAWLAAPYFYIGDREKAWSSLLPQIDLRNNSQALDRSISYSLIATTMENGKHEREANFYRALQYLEVYQYEESIEKLLDYLEEFSEDEEAHYYLACSYKGLVEVKDSLNLLGAASQIQSDLAFKEGLLALFLGMEKHLVYGLLGEIYGLKGRKNPYFYTFSLLYLEQAYLLQPLVSTVVRIAQIRLEAIILETPMPSYTEQRKKLLERLQKEVIYWLRVHFHDTLHDSTKATIYNALGACYLRILQELSRVMVEESFDSTAKECEQLLLDGELVLQEAIGTKNENFTIYLQLGNLYWEWQSWISAPEDRIHKINKAIEAWEKSQKLTRDIQLPRIQRSVREEVEISINSAMKQLKILEEE